jgi:hypothetical protein
MQRLASSYGAAAAANDHPEALQLTSDDIAALLAAGSIPLDLDVIAHCAIRVSDVTAGCQLGGKNCEAGAVLIHPLSPHMKLLQL